MFGTAQLNDDAVAAAVRGSARDSSRVLEMVQPQVRLMVTARLSPTPRQLHAVDEITQVTLAALAQNLRRLRVPTVSGLRSYLSGIVSRKVADYLRRRGADGVGGAATVSLNASVAALAADASGAGPLWQALSASGVSPRTAAENAELIAKVMDKIARLKEEYRQVITLAFFDQMTTGQIAERMAISRPAASMLLLRAMRALRRDVTGTSEILGGTG